MLVACILCKLLLDEEVFQVGKLPRAGDSENCELDENPADDAGICGFRLVSEFSFALLHVQGDNRSVMPFFSCFSKAWERRLLSKMEQHIHAGRLAPS